MSKRILSTVLLVTMLLPFMGCGQADKEVKIGVSFGVGAAARWEREKVYMEEKAEELSVGIEVRINRTDEPKTQYEDCVEMIDSGVDVLLLVPRDTYKVDDIITYAKARKVPVISYSRMAQGEEVDLFVGYDCTRIGREMGKYLAEEVYEGDYILLSGSPGDHNAVLQYKGAMHYIEPVREHIHVLLDAAVPEWSPEEAAKMVKEAVLENGNKVDAILAPNDKIAGACAEVLAELGVTQHVAITGMDAELDAVKRIAAGTQDATVYMNFKELAELAVEEAVHFARGEKVNVNAEVENQSGNIVKANMITGQLVNRDNLDRVLIEGGAFTREEVYGR